MPRLEELHVQVEIGSLPPTASTLMWLSKLHPKYSHLTPGELKATYSACPVLDLGMLNAEEVDRIKTQSLPFGFKVHVAGSL